MTCTFFGHRDTPDSVREKLKVQLIDLIKNMGVDMFYVGNHGNFDRMVIGILKTLKLIYPIDYRVVPAYPPSRNSVYKGDETEYPEGIEEIAKQFAIEYRNNWMLKCADVVVAYVGHDWGGAAKYVRTAKLRRLYVINLFEDLSK